MHAYSYAKIHIPIIASVSEHQPTTWTSFFFDLHVLVCVFPAGIWFVMKHLTDERVFGECGEGGWRPGEAQTQMQQADLAIVASGTATLELALIGVPMAH